MGNVHLLLRYKVVKCQSDKKQTNGGFDVNKINRKPRNAEMYKAILTLKTVDECMRFFDDLCTVTELQAMEQRYQVATLLEKGLIYNDILEQTGASSATISRVNRSLQFGKDGYAVVFERLKKESEKE